MHTTLVKSSKRSAARVALLTLSGFSLPAYAFQPLITDDTGTQGSAGNQLEFSLNQDRAKTAGETVRVQTLPLFYTRGLTETLDVFAGLGYTRIRSSIPGANASGAGNPSFGVKWRFYENEESKTSFAVKPEVLLPASAGREDAGLGTGKTSGNLTLILTQDVPFGAIHLNAGVGRDRYRDTSINPDTTTTRVSIAPVWDVGDQWKLALDMGTESARHSGFSAASRIRSNFVELAAVYSPSKDIDFALGLLRSSDNASPRTTTHVATAGTTWRFR